MRFLSIAVIASASAIALTQIATIIPFPDVDYAGPLPPEIQLYTVFTIATSPASNSEKVRPSR